MAGRIPGIPGRQHYVYLFDIESSLQPIKVKHVLAFIDVNAG
jgi:hypothetical protein